MIRRLVVLILLGSLSAAAQRPGVLAPNAPRDQPASVRQQCEWEALVRVLDPYVRRARATYPAAKVRFLAGLPPRHSFFVTVRLTDSLKHHEQVFLAVESIVGERLHGSIANDITTVRGFKRGDSYTVPESDLVDWLIAKPDGSEEGNIVGTFMDTYRPPQNSCTDRDRAG
jgi:hypothetical protein